MRSPRTQTFSLDELISLSCSVLKWADEFAPGDPNILAERQVVCDLIGEWVQPTGRNHRKELEDRMARFNDYGFTKEDAELLAEVGAKPWNEGATVCPSRCFMI